MENSKRALVVIPAYNEEKNIGRVINEIKADNPSIPILIVNDGSRDSTSNMARRCGALVIDLPFNMGYGVALQTAYKYAVEEGYRYVIQMDGDGQHDPKCIGTLLGEIVKGETDVVIGSRFLKKKGYKAPLSRKIGMALFNSITSWIIGQKVTDSTSGYQELKRDVLEFCGKDVYPCDYPDADVLIMLHFAGFRIKEIPVTMFPKKGGKSMHKGLKPVYYIFKMFLSIFVTLLRKKPSRKGGNG